MFFEKSALLIAQLRLQKVEIYLKMTFTRIVRFPISSSLYKHFPFLILLNEVLTDLGIDFPF